MSTENKSPDPFIPLDGPPARRRVRRQPRPADAEESNGWAGERAQSQPSQRRHTCGHGPVPHQGEGGKDCIDREAGGAAVGSAPLPDPLQQGGQMTINAYADVVICQVMRGVVIYPAPRPTAQTAD